MRSSLTDKVAQYKLIYKTIIFEKKASGDGSNSRLTARLFNSFAPYVYNALTSSDEPLVVPPPPPKDNTFSNFFKSIPINFRINPKTLITGHPEEITGSEIIHTATPYSHRVSLPSTDERQV